MTLEEQQDRFTDAYKECSLAYWNALLSVNGVLITVFSAVAIFGNVNLWLVLSLIFASMVSCWRLIMNFKLVKEGYKMLGEMLVLPSPEEQERISRESEREPIIIKRNERIVEILLFFQGVLILSILLWPYICPNG